jgi:putative transposase
MRRLRVAQRSLSRKKKGSNHWKHQKRVVGLLHEKVRNQRRDYLHKISRELVDTYDCICIEDLNIVGMSSRCAPKQDASGAFVKNGQAAKSGLNRAILDMGWGEFRTMLQYKCEWGGKNLLVIGQFEPSSKICSSCGTINKNLTLKDRSWVCGCGAQHDRDVNAAVNIKNFGLRDQPSEPKGAGAIHLSSQREARACA